MVSVSAVACLEFLKYFYTEYVRLCAYFYSIFRVLYVCFYYFYYLLMCDFMGFIVCIVFYVILWISVVEMADRDIRALFTNPRPRKRQRSGDYNSTATCTRKSVETLPMKSHQRIYMAAQRLSIFFGRTMLNKF